MLQYGTVSTDGWLDVELRDFVNCVDGEPGIVVAGLTIAIGKVGTTDGAAYSPAAGNWKEKANVTGIYSLQVGADEWTSAGNWTVDITSATSVFAPVHILVEVDAVTQQEFKAAVPAKAGDAMALAAGVIDANTFKTTGLSPAYPRLHPDSGTTKGLRTG